MSFGHVVLANSKSGVVPRIIRWITGSQFSHSLVTMPDVLDIAMCVEAADSGVSCLPFESGYRSNVSQSYEVYRVNVSEERKAAGLKVVLSELQQSYGFLELPWFIWRSLNAKFGRDIKGKDNWSEAGVICSELCVTYLRECGFTELFKDFGAGSVNAEDLRKIMTANPDLFELIEVKQ